MDNRIYIPTNQTLINPERILRKTNIEPDRVEFLPHWNPKVVFPSIVAFANDLHNHGGGYIVVGVESDLQGNALFPVKGLSKTEIEAIKKDFEKYCSHIYPQYHPLMSFAEVSEGGGEEREEREAEEEKGSEEKTILVIWAPTGEERPYSIIENPDAPLTKRQSKSYFKISNVTKDASEVDVCMFLNDVGHTSPFDNRTNPAIKISDISPILIKEYLAKTESPLLTQMDRMPFDEVLGQLGLVSDNSSLEGSEYSSGGHIQLKNVAALMFCESPEKFFENMYVRVKDYRKANVIQRSKYTEKIFRGPLIRLIPNLLEYFSTLVIEENVIRQPKNLQELKFFNYPLEAVKEGIVNALYHNDYQSGKPIEIVIDTFRISILNSGGPDKSIPLQNVLQCKDMTALTQRNCRLGDFLKQMGWTSLAYTGKANIQKQLCLNGNSPATAEGSSESDSFCLNIPAHPFTKNAKLN